MRSFQDLDVWRKAHEAVLRTYAITSAFPRTELFGLTRQVREAAVSVPANIAEGFGRRSRRDKAHFYTIALGSTEEMLYYLILARDLKYMQKDPGLTQLYQDVERMLNRLISSLDSGP